MHFCFASHTPFSASEAQGIAVLEGSAGSYTKKKKEKLRLRFSQAIQVQTIKNNQQKIK